MLNWIKSKIQKNNQRKEIKTAVHDILSTAPSTDAIISLDEICTYVQQELHEYININEVLHELMYLKHYGFIMEEDKYEYKVIRGV